MKLSMKTPTRRFAPFTGIAALIGGLALVGVLGLTLQPVVASAAPQSTSATSVAAGLEAAYTPTESQVHLAYTGPVLWNFTCKGSGHTTDAFAWNGGSNANQNEQPAFTNNLCLYSGNYRAVEQSDGNLVIYYGNHATWSTKTNGKLGSTGFFEFQDDGNFVAYANSNYKQTGSTVHAVWSTKTSGKPGPARVLAMQSDGNLVLYAAKHDSASTFAGLGVTKALWASGTSGKK